MWHPFECLKQQWISISNKHHKVVYLLWMFVFRHNVLIMPRYSNPHICISLQIYVLVITNGRYSETVHSKLLSFFPYPFLKLCLKSCLIKLWIKLKEAIPKKYLLLFGPCQNCLDPVFLDTYKELFVRTQKS